MEMQGRRKSSVRVDSGRRVNMNIRAAVHIE